MSAIYVAEVGEGVPVLLLHSSGLSGDQWRRTTEALVSDGKRVVVPDLLGSGRSPAWPEGKPLGFLDDLAEIDELLTRLDQPVHLVGHSYGGLVALRVAALDPPRIRSLTVYDPVAFGVLSPIEDADAWADLSGVWFGWGTSAVEHEAWLQTFVDFWGGVGAWQRLSARSRADMLRVGWVAHEEARSLMADRTPAEAYRVITAPTLLVGGERSPRAAQRVIERLRGVLPSARLEVIAGAGHMGPLSHAALFNDRLRAQLVAAEATS